MADGWKGSENLSFYSGKKDFRLLLLHSVLKRNSNILNVILCESFLSKEER